MNGNNKQTRKLRTLTKFILYFCNRMHFSLVMCIRLSLCLKLLLKLCHYRPHLLRVSAGAKYFFYVEQLPGFNRGTVVNFVIECSKHRKFCGWPHCSTAPQTAKMRFVTHVGRPQASSDKSKSKI